MAYSAASLAARLFNSSLYFVAAFDWYLVLGSLLLSAAVPPFDWKYFVADSLPPTFITRSWSHCHSGHNVSPPVCSKVVRYTYDQGLSIAQRRCEHPSCDDSMNNQGRDRFQKVQKSMLDSLPHNQNKSIARKHISTCIIIASVQRRLVLRTLFAGFVFNFSKSFWDCAFEARAAIFDSRIVCVDVIISDAKSLELCRNKRPLFVIGFKLLL